MQKTETRKLRKGLSQEERERAERIGSLPQGQRIKTAWSMRVEKFISSRELH
jgi:ABC-type Mn2+/Zn2+ transport system ATPase subunit